MIKLHLGPSTSDDRILDASMSVATLMKCLSEMSHDKIYVDKISDDKISDDKISDDKISDDKISPPIISSPPSLIYCHSMTQPCCRYPPHPTHMNHSVCAGQGVSVYSTLCSILSICKVQYQSKGVYSGK